MPNAELLHSALHSFAAAEKQDRALRGCPLLDLGHMANESLQTWRERPDLMLYAQQILVGLDELRLDLLPDKTVDAVARLLGVLRWIASEQ